MALCACLVVAIHVRVEAEVGNACWWFRVLLKDGVARMAVPFFFVTAGFLLAGHAREAHWWVRETGKRVRTLLVPYLIWPPLFVLLMFVLIVAANAVAGAAPSRNFPDGAVAWLRLLGWNFLGPGPVGPELYTFWFVRELFILVVCSPVLLWPLRKGKAWGWAWGVVPGRAWPRG